MSEDVVAVLTDARAAVARGWCQGTGRKGKRVCLTVALHDSSGPSTGSSPGGIGVVCPPCSRHPSPPGRHHEMPLL